MHCLFFHDLFNIETDLLLAYKLTSVKYVKRKLCIVCVCGGEVFHCSPATNSVASSRLFIAKNGIFGFNEK